MFETIVVAVDGSKCSDQALDYAAELARESGLTSTLEVHSSTIGGPAHVIADAAEKLGADVIVTGTRGHTAVAGVILGSVAQRLVHLASRPVIVVPQSSQPKSESSARVAEATV